MTSTAPPMMNQEQGAGPSPTPPQAAQQQQQGLPPTGLQQQMNSLNQLYQQVQTAGQGVKGMGRMGFDPRQQQFAQAQEGGQELEQADLPMGSTSLDQMARNLAQRYGLPIGRGRLVDESGNFLYTPQQLADASGGSVTMGEAAAQMNYISQALTRRQNEQQQQKGIAALQAGLGQVQSRGRGSLASMMSGYYQDIADMYANQEYEAADFSYYIQKEQQMIAQELQRRQEKLQKKQARNQAIMGIGLTVAGIATGNVGLTAYGASAAVGGASGAGWF